MALLHTWNTRAGTRARAAFFDSYGKPAPAGAGTPRSGYEALGGKRARRAARELGAWALGVACAALWLAVLTASNFSPVAVALGLLCVLIVLR